MFFNWKKAKMTATVVATLGLAATSFAGQQSSSSRLGVSDYYLTETEISSIGDNNDLEVVIEMITNGANDTLPIDLAFILDNSGSMGSDNKMVNAKAATDTVINHMNFANGDRGAIVTFDNNAIVRQAYTNSEDSLHAAVSPIQDAGGTDFGKGIQAALDLVGSANPEYFIFLSDGANGGADYSALLDTAVAHNIKIFTIGLGTGNVDALKNIANETNGKYYHVPISDSLPGIFRILYDFINDQVVTDIRLDAYPNNAEFGNFTAVEPNPVVAQWTDITDGKHLEYGSLPANDVKKIRFKLSELLPDQLDTGDYTVMKSALLSYKDRLGVERTIELDSLNVKVVGDSIPVDESQVVVKSANKNTYNGYKEYNAQIELHNIDTTSETGFGEEIPMQEITIRYWYDRDVAGSIDVSHVEFFDNWGTTEVHTRNEAETNVVAGASVVHGAESYVEVRFSADAGVLSEKICVQFQVQKTTGDSFDAFDVTNDYSYNGQWDYIANENITVYRNGVLIAGNEPN